MTNSLSHTERHIFVLSISLRRKLSPEELLEQRQFLQSLLADGTLILAGVFPDEVGKGMALICAASKEEAIELYSRAPVVREGLADWGLQEWRISAGKLAEYWALDR